MNMFTYYLHRHAPRNVAICDRVLRAVPAVLVVVLYLADIIGGGLALALGIPSLALLATSAMGKCGIYYALNKGTRRDAHGHPVTGRETAP